MEMERSLLMQHTLLVIVLVPIHLSSVISIMITSGILLLPTPAQVTSFSSMDSETEDLEMKLSTLSDMAIIPTQLR